VQLAPIIQEKERKKALSSVLSQQEKERGRDRPVDGGKTRKDSRRRNMQCGAGAGEYPTGHTVFYFDSPTGRA